MKSFFKSKILWAVLLIMLLPVQANAGEYWKIVDTRFYGTAGETLATGDAASLSVDGNLYKADADNAIRRPCVGVIGSKGGASGVSVEVVTSGRLAGQSGFTVGSNVYLSATAGAITSTAVAAYPQPIGYALSATEVYINAQAYSTALGAITGTTATLTGTLTGVAADFSGTVTGQGLPIEGTVYQDNIDSNQSATAMKISGGSTVVGKRAHVAGSVIQITCTSNEARTAGTATFDVTIGGTVTGLQAVLDGTNTTSHSASQAVGTDTITAGQAVGVKSSTDASWTPATADIICDFTYTGVNN